MGLILMLGCKTDCWEIGCLDGLAIELSAPLSVSGELTVVLSGDVERRCTQSITTGIGDCGEMEISFGRDITGGLTSITLYRMHPQTLMLELRANDETILGPVSRTVEYERNQPNGPNCPPLCRSGNLVIDPNE